MLRRNSPVRVHAISHEGEKESMTEGSVKQVGFKQGVKEWGSYVWGEWYINRGRSDRCRKRWVRDRETGRELTWLLETKNRFQRLPLLLL